MVEGVEVVVVVVVDDIGVVMEIGVVVGIVVAGVVVVCVVVVVADVFPVAAALLAVLAVVAVAGGVVVVVPAVAVVPLCQRYSRRLRPQMGGRASYWPRPGGERGGGGVSNYSFNSISPLVLYIENIFYIKMSRNEII